MSGNNGNNRNNGNISNRFCGECKLCCIWPEIPEMQSPENEPCKALDTLSDVCSCTIYADRPERCKAFRCNWLKGLEPVQDRPDKIGVYSYFAGKETVIFYESHSGLAMKYRGIIIANLLGNGYIVTIRDITTLKSIHLFAGFQE